MQFKQESRIGEMGFNGDLAQQQFWEAHVRFTPKSGRWPTPISAGASGLSRTKVEAQIAVATPKSLRSLDVRTIR